ncbi:class I SAM-dependent methyltransferase [Thalassospira mesophila]|uniref:Phosphoethanolamine methyltransferase n=1 Tax=Thalassospira mesophila TaxID=1293891 RepID=A0A1Y2L0Z0_9PROT|nr:phosphoethanolamine methyltransferase [Thalassospira mesophila]
MKFKFWQRKSSDANPYMDENMSLDDELDDPLDGIVVPFRKRIRARWEGYDDPAEYYLMEQQLAAYRRWLQRMMILAARPREEEPAELDLEEEAGRWPPERLKLYGKLFDRGIMKPGGHEYALELAKPLALDETMSCVEIGARIGGTARVLADKFGVWVTAMEQDGELALLGMERSVAAGSQKKVPVLHYDPLAPEFRKKYFNVVYSFGELFTVDKKDTFLLKMAESLREQGQLLITDYVITAKADESSADYKAWLAKEDIKPHPWTADRYKDVLGKLRFDIRIAKDETELHVTQIKHAWMVLLSDLQNSGLDPDFAAFLEDDMEMWMRRVKMLENGELAYYRFYATHD